MCGSNVIGRDFFWALVDIFEQNQFVIDVGDGPGGDGGDEIRQPNRRKT